MRDAAAGSAAASRLASAMSARGGLLPFAEARANGEVAPIPAVRVTLIETTGVDPK
jgi:hypothetical protein